MIRRIVSRDTASDLVNFRALCRAFEFTRFFTFWMRAFVRTIRGPPGGDLNSTAPVVLYKFCQRRMVRSLTTSLNCFAIWVDDIPSSIILVTTFRISSDFISSLGWINFSRFNEIYLSTFEPPWKWKMGRNQCQTLVHWPEFTIAFFLSLFTILCSYFVRKQTNYTKILSCAWG